jgi:hypothetical protein
VLTLKAFQHHTHTHTHTNTHTLHTEHKTKNLYSYARQLTTDTHNNTLLHSTQMVNHSGELSPMCCKAISITAHSHTHTCTHTRTRTHTPMQLCSAQVTGLGELGPLYCSHAARPYSSLHTHTHTLKQHAHTHTRTHTHTPMQLCSAQVVDLGELGPVRCSRCKAYMNPYVRFMASGKTFTCNFCGHSNQTPDSYFCQLGPNGFRWVGLPHIVVIAHNRE